MDKFTKRASRWVMGLILAIVLLVIITSPPLAAQQGCGGLNVVDAHSCQPILASQPLGLSDIPLVGGLIVNYADSYEIISASQPSGLSDIPLVGGLIVNYADSYEIISASQPSGLSDIPLVGGLIVNYADSYEIVSASQPPKLSDVPVVGGLIVKYADSYEIISASQPSGLSDVPVGGGLIVNYADSYEIVTLSAPDSTTSPPVTPSTTPTRTNTPTKTATATATPTNMPTKVATATPTNTPTKTATAANTPTPTHKATMAATITPMPTPSPVATSPAPQSIDLRAEASQESINVEWDLVGSLSGLLSNYELYRSANNGSVTLITTLTGRQYTDNDSSLTAGTQYCYQIKAIDRADNVIGQSNTACTEFGALTLWLPNEVVPVGSQNVLVPVNLANGNGLCIGAMDITLEYDSNIVQATDAVSATIYTKNYGFQANSTTPGKIRISSLTGSNQCEELYGGGSLFLIGFDVIGEQGESSPLSFIESDQQTEIHHQNEKRAVDLKLQDGQLFVGSEFVRGDIDGSEFVRSFDAKLALLIASGSRQANSQEQQACDVNGDGVCNSADSTLILCYAAFEDWGLCGGVNNQRVNEQAQNGPTIVEIEPVGQDGQTFRANVNVSNAPDFAGGDFSLIYDATQMNATALLPTELIEGFPIEINLEQTGLIRVSMAQRDAIAVNGTILQLEFSVINGISNIDLGTVRLHDAAGRDFETSALQREIELVPYEVGDALQYDLYLPLLLR